MAELPWHAQTTAQILKAWDVAEHFGLTAREAQLRLAKYGPNRLTQEKKISPFKIFLRQFQNLLTVVLLTACVLSLLVGEYVDASIISLIVLFVSILGFAQEYRAEKALDALKKMITPSITVLREGREEEVPSQSLVPGDILVLEAGDRIPADARLLESHAMKCDEAALTGESFPAEKNAEPLPTATALADQANMLFAGTSLAYGRGHAVITGTGMHTELGKIAKDVAAVQTGKTPLEKRTAEIGKWLSLTAAGICVLVTGVSLLREYLHQPLELDFALKMLMFGVALAVAAVPEALAGIVTGALAIGMHQMAKRHALVRKMSAVETLGCTTVICSDKTGTLTKGEMTVRKIVLLSGTWDVAGSGYDTAGGFSGPIPIPEAALAQLLKAGSLCNDSELYAEAGQTKVKGDPTEGALLVAAAKKGLNPLELKLQNPRIQEFPFSSERKRMTTVHRMNDGKVIAFVKGAPETILPRCSACGDSGTVQALSGEDRNALAQANDDLAQAAYRVLALACKEIRAEDADQEETVESNLIFLGLVGMMDPPRPEAVEAARICRQVRIKPVMITGDHLLTAVAVAREIGFYQQGDTVLTGAALEKLTDLEFEAIVDRVTVYARVAPRDKLRIVTAWKKRGDVVAMTGDGVNDAPALKAADIGIAMGITGTEVSKEAADMILNDDNFATIVTAIELGRWVYDNIKKYLTYLLRCNLVEVAVIGGAALIFGPEFLPLLPASILYINLGTDGLPALALGVAPADPDLMRRPPRDPRESIFSRDVVLFILASLMIEIPFFYYLFTTNLENLTHARTQMFFLFLSVELIVALNFRSMKFSVFTARPHLWLVLAVVWEFLLAALLVQLPAVRRAFGITLPSWNDLLILVSFSLLIFASLEGIKAFLRHRERKQEGCRPTT